MFVFVYSVTEPSQLLSPVQMECGLTNRKYYHVEFCGHAWKDVCLCFFCIRTIKQCVFFPQPLLVCCFLFWLKVCCMFRFRFANLVICRVFFPNVAAQWSKTTVYVSPCKSNVKRQIKQRNVRTIEIGENWTWAVCCIESLASFGWHALLIRTSTWWSMEALDQSTSHLDQFHIIFTRNK